MQTRIRALIVTMAIFSGAMAANADPAELTEVELTQVTEACEFGLPLIPVSSDYGYDTGEFALPISERDGEVHSALIISAAALQDIPECKAEIDALVRNDQRTDDRIS
ncbi:MULTISPECIES: hypothetical protein [Henriciella]|jgi:hypothetical protein|uniref:Uncharacterized protein n=1 Tax=Henriciella pelagia TaxID=1977912 RepID=A0ABQ1JB37_9PROT|nr:hypothetical protein [Henriciella pelagia]GGB62297.1 hypothetical protein GCM10011503_08660 [Henriciella pelagia]